MAKPPPQVLSLIVADQIYRDDFSATLSILGVRTMVLARSLPLQYPRRVAYAAVVEGRGTVSFELRVADVDEEREPVYQIEAEATFPDPLTEAELLFEMQDLVFPEAGEYRIQLRVDGQFLSERRLMIVPATRSQNQ